MDERRTIGDQGEALVAGYLTSRGWCVLARNWRCPDGEVDLVCLDPDGASVICEVKSRSGRGYGTPLEAVTREKAQRLRRLAARWAREQDAGVAALRVDAFGVLWHADGTASIQHVRGVE